ncbi:sirtuin 7 [Dermatophagoides farinae]|uniref:sirtuin 7 n=1 Tax=Dermatophagoides farinae TaxID=6954 RepID=UPI003F5F8139
MTETYSRACKMKTLHKSFVAQEFKHVKKRIQEILMKSTTDITKEEKDILKRYKNLAKLVQSQRRNHNLRKEREQEIEDDINTLRFKCTQLVELIRSSNHIIVYTGAGISTSASIPDYRGPNGVWTRIKNGDNTPNVNDLAFSEPTFTHMAIVSLMKQNIIKHVVSQNCDGLHLRSGIPSECLSEIHGNMYIEVCRNCKKSYTRSFDVTEKTALRRHETGRHCHQCPPDVGKLIDTIVHFGEKGKLKHPLRWEAATNEAQKADLIICMGSSLKILRKYACLWPKNKQKNKKNKLAIINLQWTPKDSQAVIKINGKCDIVMKELMAMLNISLSSYERQNDQVLRDHKPLLPEEEHTCNRIRLEQLFQTNNEMINIEKLNTMQPAWFGKGVHRKK